LNLVNRPLRAADATALAVIAGTAMAACSDPRQPERASSYLALRDSLSRGVQPDAAGASVETPQGYLDFVYALLRPGHPALKLVRLRRPGETAVTMVRDGVCRYRGGSQLAAPVDYRVVDNAVLKAAGVGVTGGR
jgi:hypothetical protein